MSNVNDAAKQFAAIAETEVVDSESVAKAHNLLEQVYCQGWEEGVRYANEQLNRAVRDERAEAWDEGYQSGWDDSDDEVTVGALAPNPYREVPRNEVEGADE